jgi:hypothetical protein
MGSLPDYTSAMERFKESDEARQKLLAVCCTLLNHSFFAHADLCRISLRNMSRLLLNILLFETITRASDRYVGVINRSLRAKICS